MACREMDLAILQDALAKEAAEEAAEADAREAKRQAAVSYRRQLAAMMAKQEADQSELDARVEAANAQQQAKREAEWAARDAARRKLMAEVDKIRQEQIARKGHERWVGAAQLSGATAAVANAVDGTCAEVLLQVYCVAARSGVVRQCTPAHHPPHMHTANI